MAEDYEVEELLDNEGNELSIPDADDSEMPLGTVTALLRSAGIDKAGGTPHQATYDDIAEAIGSDGRVVIRAYIEPGPDGFWVYTYSPENVGAYSYGKTIKEAKKSLLEGIEGLVESYEEDGDKDLMPLSIRGDFRVEFDIQPALRDFPEDKEVGMDIEE